MIFLLFFQFVFFHGKQTNWSQNWPKVTKICVYFPFIIFVKKKFNLKILKCVKVNTVILAIFSSYFVTYDSNFLRWCIQEERTEENSKNLTKMMTRVILCHFLKVKTRLNNCRSFSTASRWIKGKRGVNSLSVTINVHLNVNFSQSCIPPSGRRDLIRKD